MCLIVKKGTKEKIAENDIICYKTLWTHNGILEADCQNFIYELGRLYTTKFTTAPQDATIGDHKGGILFADNLATDKYGEYFNPDDIYDCGGRNSQEITAYWEGFHSYKEEHQHYSRRANVECTIPKGTKYIEDETGLICSEAIIINKILE